MGKYNVGIGLYNDKLSVYAIEKGKFIRINDKNTENIDIFESLKLIRSKCKEYYRAEEEIEVVLSLQEKLSEEVKYKMKNLINLSGFILKEEIKESLAITLAYGIEYSDELIFIININKNNSTLNVISYKDNLDLTLPLDINLKDNKGSDNLKVIEYIKEKIECIQKELKAQGRYKVILVGDILNDNSFNNSITQNIDNIYNYRKDVLSMGCAVKSYDNSYDIKVLEKNITKESSTSKCSDNIRKEKINIGYFYYINKEYEKAKELLIESIKLELDKSNEFIKILICLLDIYLIEGNVEQALKINSKILQININDKLLIEKYKKVISENKDDLLNKHRMKTIRFKYEIINIIDDGFEFDIDTNQRIRDYEISLKNNSSILNLDEEFLIDELEKEIKIIDKKIEKQNIQIFYNLRDKIKEIIEYFNY